MGFATNWPSTSAEEKGSRPLGISHKAEEIGWEEDMEAHFLYLIRDRLMSRPFSVLW